MVNIAQSQILLRAQSELPAGLKFVTEVFREGWEFVRSTSAPRLGQKLMTHGWSFVSPTDGSQGNGVGDTSSEAIDNALKLALRHLDARFNAAEVKHIDLTRYPWFFLARVRVLPYCIQQGTAAPLLEEPKEASQPRRQRRVPFASGTLYPQFSYAMPQLKKMLISSPGSPT